MKGLELSENYYWEVVAPLIRRHFPVLQERYAAGLIGYGSDVLEYDDELSHDHEWGPRGQLWLSPRDYARYARRIDLLFAEKLPHAYLGYSARYVVEPSLRCLVPAAPGKAGIHHIAITTVRRYLKIQTGIRRMPIDVIDWLCLPEQKLLEFTRGRIFYDPPGEITHLRQSLAWFPDDVWRAKLLYAWSSANEVLDIIPLNVLRGDPLMARLNLNRLVERIMRIGFLLNRRYCPGTSKWQAREFSSLPRLAQEASPVLEACLVIDDLSLATGLLEQIFQLLVGEHNRLGLTRTVSLKAPVFGRGLIPYSLDDVVAALQTSLPPHLTNLEIQGGLDQWITNPDILIWAEQTAKFKRAYKKKSRLKRDGIGDLII